MYIMLYSTVLRDNFQGLIFSQISNQAAKFSTVKMDVQCISPLKKTSYPRKVRPLPHYTVVLHAVYVCLMYLYNYATLPKNYLYVYIHVHPVIIIIP